MKRFVFLLILSILVFSSLSAVSIAIAPYNAFSGIPVGNSYYHANAKGSWVSNKWVNDGASINSGKENYFTDQEMIGVVSVHGSSSYFTLDGSITITASAPNGLYMASQQEPSYRRPIEIWFYPSYGRNGDTRLGSAYNKQLSNETPSSTWFATKSETPSGITNYSYDAIWFDVVLVLPGKLNPDTNEIEVTDSTTGKTIYYPLVTADDYSSVVTITVTYTPWSGGSSVVESITIPFTGYYDASTGSTQKIKSSSVSMNVTLESTAYNMNLKNQGSPTDIGELTFMSENSKSIVFFSSSADPFVKGSTFSFVKTGLGVNTKLTSENSLGFKIQVDTPTDTSSLYSKDVVEYDGTTYISSDLTSGSVSNSTLASNNMIIPDVTYYYPKHQGTKTKYTYSSRIKVILDDAGGLLLAGRYTADVYVHVMTYE